MKLSVIGPVYPYRGGISTYTSELCHNLVVHGHETQILTYTRMYPKWLYPGRSMVDNSLPVSQEKSLKMIDPYNTISWKKTADKIIDFNPDLVILEWWVTFWAFPYGSIIRSMRKANIHTIYQIHNVLPHEPAWFDRKIAFNALSGVDGYLLHSEREKRKLVELLGTELHLYRVCPLPLLPPQPGERWDPVKAKISLGLPADAKVLLFFGIVRPYKGLASLLAAASRIIPAYQDVHLVIAGEFWENSESFRRQALDLGIEKHVHIIDQYIPSDQVGMYFSAADVFVAPYLAGSQSGAMKIAMGYGVPIVSSDSIVDDMIQYPERCYAKFHAGDVDDLVKALHRMLASTRRPAINKLSDRSWQDLVHTIESLCCQINSTRRVKR
jgi:glycosyltransferase involved in cell wall biosynthesis